MTIKEEKRENHEIDNADVFQIITNTTIPSSEAIGNAIKILNKRFDKMLNNLSNETLINLSNLSLYKELDHNLSLYKELDHDY